ncbi:MAG: hypothetical protein HGA84_07630 [Syntrophobacteraceae bacterium]|nr:hypothetical protein [Syntrophobacteraceae bacterium]
MAQVHYADPPTAAPGPCLLVLNFITGCANCTSTIGILWPTLVDSLTKAEQKRVEKLAEKTMDATQLLVDILQVKAENKFESPFEKTVVTWHDPCHLKKSLGVSSQPRVTMQANHRCQLKEMIEPHRINFLKTFAPERLQPGPSIPPLTSGVLTAISYFR